MYSFILVLPYSCFSLELLISLIPCPECSYFISHSTASLQVFSVCLLPRLGSPGSPWPPDPVFLSQDCIPLASHLPPSNLSRTILEVELAS